MTFTLEDLKIGFTFFFENTTWKVTEMYKIKWNDGTKSKEFKVKSLSGTIRYLEIEYGKKNKKTYSFWTKQSDKSFLYEGQKLVKDYVSIGSAKFPKSIAYNDVYYEFDERTDGTCTYDYGEKEKVNSLDYTNKDDTKFLAIEFWDDEIEVSTGVPIKQTDISRIEKAQLSLTNNPVINFIGKYARFVVVGIFLLFMILANTCSKRGGWNDDSNTYNDSTKVKRYNNGYYRSRNSSGFGK